MTDSELMALDKMGFIPGPGEKEEDFLLRVDVVKKKYEGGSWIPESHWDWVRAYLDQMFNVKPLYICAFYSNRKLAPWEGAASWIDGRTLSSIQLRSKLRKGSYLGIYSREEILTHEAVHAARSGFDESRYEEFFAYMTSEKRWRRALGPILRRPWEAWPFLMAACLGVVWPLFYWGATFWAGCGFWRLIREHRALGRAAEKLLKRVRDQRIVRAILFRLTDREIRAISRGENIDAYAQRQTCLRWRIIQNYLKGMYV